MWECFGFDLYGVVESFLLLAFDFGSCVFWVLLLDCRLPGVSLVFGGDDVVPLPFDFCKSSWWMQPCWSFVVMGSWLWPWVVYTVEVFGFMFLYQLLWLCFWLIFEIMMWFLVHWGLCQWLPEAMWYHEVVLWLPWDVCRDCTMFFYHATLD